MHSISQRGRWITLWQKGNELNLDKSGRFPTLSHCYSGHVGLPFAVKLLVKCKDKYCISPTF